jgi:SOS-response transcriptional repressor LexA
MYEIGDIILSRRKALGLSQTELAEAMTLRGLPVTNQAVSKWENGATQPSARQFLALCELLEIEDVRGEFSFGAEGLFAGLDSRGRRMALDYVQLLRDSGRYDERRAEPMRRRMLPLYSLAVSAGMGQMLDGEDYEMVEVGAEVPEGAHFGVRIAGDSMEPRYHDGQTVWVRQQRSLMSGEIGIFLYDGSAYLKKLVARGEQMALHSLNPDYADILISPELPLRVLGKVVS